MTLNQPGFMPLGIPTLCAVAALAGIVSADGRPWQIAASVVFGVVLVAADVYHYRLRHQPHDG